MTGTGDVSEAKLWMLMAPSPFYCLHETETDLISQEERNEEEVLGQKMWCSPLKMGREPTGEGSQAACVFLGAHRGASDALFPGCQA